MSMTGPKQLMKQYPLLGAAWTAPEANWTPTAETSWTQYDTLSNTFFYQEGYFDLTGMKLEDLTIKLQGIAMQRAYEPVVGGFLGQAWAEPVQLHCWIPSSPLVGNDTYTGIELACRRAIYGEYPSFPASKLDWTNLLFAESTMFSSNGNIGLTSKGFMTPLYTKLYGSNEPSANEKMYVYVVWRIADDPLMPLATCTLPELRVAVAAEIFEEKELAYIERMRRSYVQQNN
mgnify:CR=1 FL=1